MLKFYKILLATVCVGCLYLMKVFIVEYVFHYACMLYPEGMDITRQQIIGGIFLNVIDLAIMAVAIFLIQRETTARLLRFFLYIMMISPLFLEVSDIFADKSCLKAWQHPLKTWWHFVIGLPVWLLVIERMKKYHKWFSSFDYLLIVAIFIAYHFIKKY